MKVSFVVGFTSYGPLKWFLKQGNFRSEVVSIRNSVCLIFLWKACILSGVGVNSCEWSVYFVVLVSRRFFVGVYLYVRSCVCPAWAGHTFCFDKISFLAFSVFVCFVDVLQVAKVGCVKVFFYIVLKWKEVYCRTAKCSEWGWIPIVWSRRLAVFSSFHSCFQFQSRIFSKQILPFFHWKSPTQCKNIMGPNTFTRRLWATLLMICCSLIKSKLILL